MKYEGTPYEEQVRQQPTAAKSKSMGGDRSLPRRSDWQEVCSRVRVPYTTIL